MAMKIGEHRIHCRLSFNQGDEVTGQTNEAGRERGRWLAQNARAKRSCAGSSHPLLASLQPATELTAAEEKGLLSEQVFGSAAWR